MIPLFAAAAVLSSLGTLPKAPPVKADLGSPGVTVTQVATKDPYYEMTTKKGYCIEPAWGRLTNEYSSNSKEDDERPTYLVRLAEKDGKATFERQRLTFEVTQGTLALSPVVSVALQEVARADGVTVWAFRDGKDVVLVSRAFDSGYESGHKNADEAGTFTLVGTDGCAFATARLDASAARFGTAAEVHGELPKKGKGKDAVTPTFTVYASLSRLSRDPEPTLAVRVRVKE